MRKLILASISPYRQQLMNRLQIIFETAVPTSDETPIDGEPADARALRLAEAKACSLAGQFKDALILGSDQTIADGDTIFDKPGHVENAIRQLKNMRGRTVRFYTAVALLDTIDNTLTTHLVTHTARLRLAEDEEIERYVNKESALNCAGGAQIEGLGITLMEDIQGGDPTALIGMPLIATANLLRQKGLVLP